MPQPNNFHLWIRQQIESVCAWCAELEEGLAAVRDLSQELLAGLAEIDRQAETYFEEMDFGFLFDEQRQVVSYWLQCHRRHP